MIAPSTPSGTSSARAQRSVRVEIPPLATTGLSVAAQTWRSSSRLGPASMPSEFTSVTTKRAQPASSRRLRVSNSSPPSWVQPRAASRWPRTSRPMAIRSPYWRMTSSHQSGCSRAAVPMLTRAHPVASARCNDSSSRMPPDSSTSSCTCEVTSAMISALLPRPNAASRSTRCNHSAPACCQRSAAALGSPNSFSEPARPWTSWTAWPPATSTAGSSTRRLGGAECTRRPYRSEARSGFRPDPRGRASGRRH